MNVNINSTILIIALLFVILFIFAKKQKNTENMENTSNVAIANTTNTTNTNTTQQETYFPPEYVNGIKKMNSTDRLYSGNYVIRNNFFLPLNMIGEGEKIPRENKDTYWYYGFPKPQDPPSREITISRDKVDLSGFVWKKIPANSTTEACNVATFHNIDPMPNIHKFCFQADPVKIFESKVENISARPSGISEFSKHVTNTKDDGRL